MRLGANKENPSHSLLQDTSKKPWRGKQDTRGGSNVRNQSGHNPSKSTRRSGWWQTGQGFRVCTKCTGRSGNLAIGTGQKQSPKPSRIICSYSSMTISCPTKASTFCSNLLCSSHVSSSSFSKREMVCSQLETICYDRLQLR